MAKTIQQASPVSAELNEQQKQAAVIKIERRIKKLGEIDVDTINKIADTDVYTNEIDALLHDIFGANTVQYNRYKHLAYFGTSSFNIFTGPDPYEMRRAFADHIRRTIASLCSIRDGFNDDLSDAELNKPSTMLKIYHGLPLHPEIAHVADKLYKDGHYSQAVEASVKRLIHYVKDQSGFTHTSATSVMQHVFSVDNPILSFSALQDQSEKDEQLGFMNLMVGIVLGVRNPRAHEFIEDDPELALGYIAFISLLMNRVDETVKVRTNYCEL